MDVTYSLNNSAYTDQSIADLWDDYSECWETLMDNFIDNEFDKIMDFWEDLADIQDFCHRTYWELTNPVYDNSNWNVEAASLKAAAIADATTLQTNF